MLENYRNNLVDLILFTLDYYLSTKLSNSINKDRIIKVENSDYRVPKESD